MSLPSSCFFWKRMKTEIANQIELKLNSLVLNSMGIRVYIRESGMSTGNIRVYIRVPAPVVGDERPDVRRVPAADMTPQRRPDDRQAVPEGRRVPVEQLRPQGIQDAPRGLDRRVPRWHPVPLVVPEDLAAPERATQSSTNSAYSRDCGSPTSPANTRTSPRTSSGAMRNPGKSSRCRSDMYWILIPR